MTDTQVPEFELCDRLRLTMRVSGISRAEMAEYLEKSPNTVTNWINGHSTPSPSDLKVWALRMGVPYEWLRGNDDRPRGPWAPPDLNRQPSDYKVAVLRPRARVVPLATRPRELAA